MPSLYDVTIPVFISQLGNLSNILDKARAHADATRMAQSELTEARLAPDMHPLTSQVQIATDTARGVAVRVGGVAPKPMADTEKTFDELQARIAATIEYLKAVPASAFDGKDAVPVPVKFGPREFTFPSGDAYVLGFATPNFFFHVTTAYDILRHKGVPLGKRDFLGG
jgi:hypothetical protein